MYNLTIISLTTKQEKLLLSLLFVNFPYNFHRLQKSNKILFLFVFIFFFLNPFHFFPFLSNQTHLREYLFLHRKLVHSVFYMLAHQNITADILSAAAGISMFF